MLLAQMQHTINRKARPNMTSMKNRPAKRMSVHVDFVLVDLRQLAVLVNVPCHIIFFFSKIRMILSKLLSKLFLLTCQSPVH